MRIFKDDEGRDIEKSIDENLMKNLDTIKDSVLKRNWDYLAVVSGVVGVGKSTLAQFICKYLDPTFTTKGRICFNAFGKDGLIERTANATLGQAFMLDESFADLNTRVTRSPEFIAIINHLQLIRQKGLYIILCLPNFFDLSKGIAIFRAHHLFVVYHDSYKRGYFAGFGQQLKRQLYIKGNKFLDYNCVQPNFRARFGKKWIADSDLYEKLKDEHLKSQFSAKKKATVYKDTIIRNRLVKRMRADKYKLKDIAEIGGISHQTVHNILKKEEEEEIS